MTNGLANSNSLRAADSLSFSCFTIALATPLFDLPRISTYLRARNAAIICAFHALVGGCEEDVDDLPSGHEHDVYKFPGHTPGGVFQSARQPPEARFPRHQTCSRVPEQLFVVFADGVGHGDGRDVGAHGGGEKSFVWSGGDGKSAGCAAGLLEIEVVGVLWLFWWRWKELGLCCWVARDRGSRCLVVVRAVLNGIGLVAIGRVWMCWEYHKSRNRRRL